MLTFFGGFGKKLNKNGYSGETGKTGETGKFGWEGNDGLNGRIEGDAIYGRLYTVRMEMKTHHGASLPQTP